MRTRAHTHATYTHTHVCTHPPTPAPAQVPLLRCMSDPSPPVRAQASGCFGSLVALLPLAQGAPMPPGLDQAQQAKVAQDTAFLMQVGGALLPLLCCAGGSLLCCCRAALASCLLCWWWAPWWPCCPLPNAPGPGRGPAGTGGAGHGLPHAGGGRCCTCCALSHPLPHTCCALSHPLPHTSGVRASFDHGRRVAQQGVSRTWTRSTTPSLSRPPP